MLLIFAHELAVKAEIEEEAFQFKLDGRELSVRWHKVVLFSVYCTFVFKLSPENARRCTE